MCVPACLFHFNRHSSSFCACANVVCSSKQSRAWVYEAHMYMCARRCVQILLSINEYTCTYMYTDKYRCVCARVDVYKHVHVYAYTHTTHKHMYIYIYIHICFGD